MVVAPCEREPASAPAASPATPASESAARPPLWTSDTAVWFVVMVAGLSLLVLLGVMASLPPISPVLPGDVPGAAAPTLRVDINHAHVSQLTLLPGVGDRMAQRIIEERTRGGPFTSVADIERVRGIGPKVRARLEPWVTIVIPTPAPADP